MVGFSGSTRPYPYPYPITVMARSELVQRLDSAYKTWREEEKFSTP